jgi:hypothetical protein
MADYRASDVNSSASQLTFDDELPRIHPIRTQVVDDVESSLMLKFNCLIRSVAQSGSAPGLGPGGPRFESLHSDQIVKFY